MMIKVFEVNVTQTVEVTLDESKFSKEFLEEFKEYFYDFDDMEEHAKHLAQLKARELIDYDGFIEGYGNIEDMEISLEITDQFESIEDTRTIEGSQNV